MILILSDFSICSKKLIEYLTNYKEYHVRLNTCNQVGSGTITNYQLPITQYYRIGKDCSLGN